MSKLKDRLEKGQFVVTGEIGPPKGVDLEKCLHDAEMLRDHVTAINVTDQQSAVLRIGSMSVSARLVQRGLEPVYQLTCRDRNRLALQSDLLSAWALGIENVLCITGDHPILGDHTEAKPVYDLDSVQLLQAASRRRTWSGPNPLGRPANFRQATDGTAKASGRSIMPST